MKEYRCVVCGQSSQWVKNLGKGLCLNCYDQVYRKEALYEGYSDNSLVKAIERDRLEKEQKAKTEEYVYLQKMLDKDFYIPFTGDTYSDKKAESFNKAMEDWEDRNPSKPEKTPTNRKNRKMRF